MTWKLNYLTVEDNIARQAQLSAVEPSSPPVTQTDANFPVSNMQTLPVSKPGRITNNADSVAGTGSMNLQVEFTVAQSLNVIALVGHNLSSGATITLNGGSSFNPTVSQGTMTWRRRLAWKYFSVAESHKYWNIEILDDANIHNFAQIGYLVMGTLTELDFGFNLSSYFTDEVLGIRASTETSVPLNRHLSERLRMRLDYQHETISDINSLRAVFLEHLGPNTPALFIPDTGGTEAIFGRIDQDSFERRYVTSSIASSSVDIVDDPTGLVALPAMPILKDGVELPSSSTFVRATVASYKNEKLELVEAASGTLRSAMLGNVAGITTTGSAHHYGYGLKGTLLEPTRTNAWTYSEDYGDSGDGVWTKTNCTITDNDLQSPKTGTDVTADKIVESSDGGATAHSVYRAIAGATDDTLQSYSAFFKADERSRVMIQTISKANTTSNSTVNLSTGAIVSQSGNHNLLVEEYISSWWRVQLSFDVESGGTTPGVSAFLDDGSGTSYTGNGSSGLHMWGLQIEVDAAFPSAYIATGAATATRNIDQLQFDWSHVPQSVTLYVRMVDIGINFDPGATVRLIEISDFSAASHRIILYWNGTNFVFHHQQPAGTVTVSRTPSQSLGDTLELRAIVYPDGSIKLGHSLNGAAESLSSASAARAFDSAWLSSTELHMNHYTTAGSGVNLYQDVKMVRGVQSLESMREL